MGWRLAYAPFRVYLNSRRAGTLTRAPSGAIARTDFRPLVQRGITFCR